jgi:hypothetical protein
MGAGGCQYDDRISWILTPPAAGSSLASPRTMGFSTMSIERRRPLPSSPHAARWSKAGEEPDLAEMLADPVVHLVMRRDGVNLEELLAVIADARAKLWKRLCPCVAA